MTITERNTIVEISKRIEHGDLKEISIKSGYSREYVGKALNPEHDMYIEKIVVAAVEYLKEKDEGKKKLLETISELDLNEG